MSTLRNEFLVFNPFRSKTVEVAVPVAPVDGQDQPPKTLKVKIRQPSVEERSIIFSDAKVNREGEVSNAASFRTGALAIIYCVRDPETDQPVFEHADLDSLLKSPAGGWVDKLASSVMELLAEGSQGAKK